MIDKSKIFRDNIGKKIDFWLCERSEDNDLPYRGRIQETDGFWVAIMLEDGDYRELHYIQIDKITEIWFHGEDNGKVLEVQIKARSREKVIKE